METEDRRLAVIPESAESSAFWIPVQVLLFGEGWNIASTLKLATYGPSTTLTGCLITLAGYVYAGYYFSYYTTRGLIWIRDRIRVWSRRKAH